MCVCVCVYICMCVWSLHLPSVSELRQKVSQEHEVGKQKERAEAPKASYGYGGKFGVEKDRMDKVRL